MRQELEQRLAAIDAEMNALIDESPMASYLGHPSPLKNYDQLDSELGFIDELLDRQPLLSDAELATLWLSREI